MLDLELATAIDLARKASLLVLDYYNKGVKTQQKVGVDNFTEPVTVADKAASSLIVDGLNSTFKDDFVLSEEEQDIRGPILEKNGQEGSPY
jgi:myo-inositol-1(or 4)-monophosphatase